MDASLWCNECKFSYCAICWNAVPHHEFVHPDEVWRNRSPRHAIEKCDHSVTGLHVHLTPEGLVSQGLYDKKKIKITRTKRLSSSRGNGLGLNGTAPSSSSPHRGLRRSVGLNSGGNGDADDDHEESRHRLSNFPSTDSIMERGFNHAEDWADLEDERSFTSEGCGLSLTGLQKAEKNDLKITLPVEEKGMEGGEEKRGREAKGDEEHTTTPSVVTATAHKEITDENSVDEGEEVVSQGEGGGDGNPLNHTAEEGQGQGSGEGEEGKDKELSLPTRQQSNKFLFSFDSTQPPGSHPLSNGTPLPSSSFQSNRSYLPPRQQSPPGRYGREISDRAKSPKNLMWQVSPSVGSPHQRGKQVASSTLTTVNRMKVSPHLKQMKGITYQFSSPKEWTAAMNERSPGVTTVRGSESQQLEFTIHRGVSVATIRR
jgi:hypothetical protein